MTKGMATRIGDNSTPSKALLARHVNYLDEYFENLYRTAPSDALRCEFCRGALTNLGLWLGWFRGGELLSRAWRDLLVVDPKEGSEFELPDHVGAIRFDFDGPTKGSRTRDIDVWLAYTSHSGLSLGKWFHRLRRHLGWPSFFETGDLIFVHDDGRPWTSAYYRTTYLVPVLNMLRLQGDPYLTSYDGSSESNSLGNVFYSLSCYRSGARTHVSRRRAGCLRAATAVEVYCHGRWRYKRSSLPIDQHYEQPSVLDRLAITLFCA
jgi:hypothetical protein